MVRRAAETDPHLAGRALAGLRVYQHLPRLGARQTRPVLYQCGAASLRDCGGSGKPIVLVPSLINPPHILDLDPGCSLADALTTGGRVLLLDWGPAANRRLSLSGHVRELLNPLLANIPEPPILVGYCLGGTMALAAAGEIATRGVVTLASPWDFDGYPADARVAFARLWQSSRSVAEALGALPIEVLQAAFWSLNPDAVVGKYAELAMRDPTSPGVQRFVALEDWANTGEALPLAAAAELVEQLFEKDQVAAGDWFSLPEVPTLHFTATGDRIVPAATVAPGERRSVPAGHVGMIVGRSAPAHLHAPLQHWLASH